MNIASREAEKEFLYYFQFIPTTLATEDEWEEFLNLLEEEK